VEWFSSVLPKKFRDFTLNSWYVLYRGADKSLAGSGRKQATTTEDFDVHISYL